MAVGILVGVAEVGLFVIYGGRVEGARRREREIRERKVVVRDGKGQGSDGSVEEDGREVIVGVDTETETEEIWGRGANGGMRRRVREKWERERDKEQSEEGRLLERTKDK